MGRPHLVNGAIDDATFTDLKRLAVHFGCTIEHLVATAVMRFVDEEVAVFADSSDHPTGYRTPEIDWASVDKADTSFAAFIQRGLDDIAAGRTVPHDQMMRRLRERYESRHAAE